MEIGESGARVIKESSRPPSLWNHQNRQPVELSNGGSMLDEAPYLRKKRHKFTECVTEKIQGRFGT